MHFIITLLAICTLARAAAPPAKPLGPDVVILKELVNVYEPVPFDHKTHAEMAQMWDGCVTCHHRSPEAGATATNGNGAKTQADAAAIPACKSCHDPAGKGTDLRMPNLKGAYHRQCLNCHREWSHANACGACHKPRDPKRTIAATLEAAPTVDDIVGRMHPPIPEPDVKVYTARFTPAVGKQAIFRHKEHTATYGLRCAQCHHRENCSHCHVSGSATQATHQPARPLKPGRTWQESHTPCIRCHESDSCRKCHFDAGSEAPPAFVHASTGQLLDKDHASLKCQQCHGQLRSKVELSCGGTECHASRLITWPADLPGPKAPPPVTVQVAIADEEAASSATTQPTTRAVIKRIRR